MTKDDTKADAAKKAAAEQAENGAAEKAAAEQAEKDAADKLQLDAKRIKELCDLIDGRVKSDPNGLAHRLEIEERMQVTRDKASEGRCTVEMAGITATGNQSAETSLINWANAARRALLQQA